MSKKKQESDALKLAKKVNGTSPLVAGMIVLIHARETGDVDLIARAEAAHEALLQVSRIETAALHEFNGTREPANTARLDKLSAIIEGMNGDLEELGATPSNVNLRDRMRSVTTAVRDLAQIVVDLDGRGSLV